MVHLIPWQTFPTKHFPYFKQIYFPPPIHLLRIKTLFSLLSSSPSPSPKNKETEKKMFRNGGKRCLERLLERRSILIENGISMETQTTFKNQQSRAYARSPLLFRKLKHSSSPLFSSSSVSSFSSTSTSASTKTTTGFIGWYLGMIESRPILTKSITSAGIYTVADLTSQVITGTSSESVDLTRTLRMAGYGMLIMGPSLHCWFNFVSRVLPKRDTLTTFKKIFIGQTTYGPVMTTVFFTVNSALQGESGADIAARLKRDLIPTLKNGLFYWPICDFITFKFIPVHLQPLVSNSFAYLWTIYITYMASLSKAGPTKIATE